MKYTCPKCNKTIEVDFELKFCPFCGSSLDGEAIQSSLEQLSKQAIDDGLVSSLVYSNSNKDKYISGTIDLIESNLNRDINCAINDINFEIEEEKEISFYDEYDEVSYSKNKSEFFDKLNSSLNKVKSIIERSNDNYTKTFDFKKYIAFLNENDNLLRRVLGVFNIDADIEKVDNIDMYGKIECISIEKDRLNITFNKLVQLKDLASNFISKNNIYINNFYKEYKINDKFFKNIENGKLQEIVSQLTIKEDETDKNLDYALNDSYDYDLLEETSSIDKMMEAFWNGYYQLIVYAKKRKRKICYIGNQPCDPYKELRILTHNHYEKVLQQISKLDVTLRSNTIEELYSFNTSVSKIYSDYYKNEFREELEDDILNEKNDYEYDFDDDLNNI